MATTPKKSATSEKDGKLNPELTAISEHFLTEALRERMGGGSVRVLPRLDKVAILGGMESKHEAPWADSSFEFWGHNNMHAYTEGKPWSRWFQLHNRPYLEKHWAWGMPHHLQWAREQRYLPFYVFKPEEWKDCPTAKRFPVEDIWALTPRGKYHAGTADWLVAYAILLGFTDIHLYGWGLGPTDSGEPFSGRACLEYWCGVADGRGIKVVAAGDNLFRTYYYVKSHRQYGFHDLRNEIEDEITT